MEGCSEEVGVTDGGRFEGVVLQVRGGWAWNVAEVLRVDVDVLVGLVGLGGAGLCRVASWLRGGVWGALVVSWRPADGDRGVCVGRGVDWWTSGSCSAW